MSGKTVSFWRIARLSEELLAQRTMPTTGRFDENVPPIDINKLLQRMERQQLQRKGAR